MAAKGMRFTNCYAGESICSPSRAALMTGRLPIRNGVYTSWSYPNDNLVRVFYPWRCVGAPRRFVPPIADRRASTGSLPASEVTVANLVKAQGYGTSLVGKWHLGHVDALPTTVSPLSHFRSSLALSLSPSFSNLYPSSTLPLSHSFFVALSLALSVSLSPLGQPSAATLRPDIHTCSVDSTTSSASPTARMRAARPDMA